jgi:hypothetical protein
MTVVVYYRLAVLEWRWRGAGMRLESLPEDGISMDQIDALAESEAMDLAAPLVVDTSTSLVTHLDIVLGERHYFVGWNPSECQWERMLVVVDSEDELVVESTIDAFDDASGEPTTTLDRHSEMNEITAFVQEYVEHTYPETSGLFNVMEHALEELSTSGE